MSDSKHSFWPTPNGIGALGLIGSMSYFLLAEHRAHFIYGLPYLILLLCPHMHTYMHRGHDGHGRHQRYKRMKRVKIHGDSKRRIDAGFGMRAH